MKKIEYHSSFDLEAYEHEAQDVNYIEAGPFSVHIGLNEIGRKFVAVVPYEGIITLFEDDTPMEDDPELNELLGNLEGKPVNDKSKRSPLKRLK